MQFIPFPKLPRLARKCVISEKIDGTNAQVAIVQREVYATDHPGDAPPPNLIAELNDLYVFAGSRTRWVTPESDNFGFSSWVRDNAECLAELGPGHHFGEWWGKGIQRNYGLGERRFSLFNAERWQSSRPACCHCVPVLYRGPFSTEAVDDTLAALVASGSMAAPGFADPEGIVVFHAASNSMFKKTAKNDEQPKGKAPSE